MHPERRAPMPCPVCGANILSFKPGEEATSASYACGFTAEDVLEGRHAAPRRHSRLPAWGFAAIAFVVLVAWALIWSWVSSGDGLMIRLVVGVQVVGVFALYALWRIVRALEGGRPP